MRLLSLNSIIILLIVYFKTTFSLTIQPTFIQTVGSASPESGSGYRLYNTLPAGLTKCKTDLDCEPNKFCRFYKELNYCDRCIDCGRYDRYKPNKGCAKNISLCGACKDGFKEIESKCVQAKPDSTPSPATSTSDLINPTNLKIILIFVGIFVGILIIMVLCVIGFCIWKKKKKNRVIKKENSLKFPIALREETPLVEFKDSTDIAHEDSKILPTAPFLDDNNPGKEHDNLRTAETWNRPNYEQNRANNLPTFTNNPPQAINPPAQNNPPAPNNPPQREPLEGSDTNSSSVVSLQRFPIQQRNLNSENIISNEDGGQVLYGVIKTVGTFEVQLS